MRPQHRLLNFLRKNAVELEEAWEKIGIGGPCPVQALANIVSAGRNDIWDSGEDFYAIRYPVVFPPMLVTAQNLCASVVKHFADLNGFPLHVVPANSRKMFEGTRMINLKTSFASYSRYPKNASTIIHHFMSYILSEIHKGRKVLLICKKKQMELSKRVLEKSNKKLCGNLEFITSTSSQFGVTDFTRTSPEIVPIIHFNMVGINSFEHYHNAICLSSYYVKQWELNEVFNRVHRPEQELEGEIKEDGEGYRRATLPKRGRELNQVYTDLFNNLERDAVLNTVGRVRPWTHARTVIVQQKNIFDTEDLITVSNFRQLHDILGTAKKTFPKLRREMLLERDAELQSQGLGQKARAIELGICTRTLQRYRSKREEIRQKCDTSPNI